MEQNIEVETLSSEENKETRNVYIGAKVTPSQKEYIKSQAEKCGMTVSDYLLACAYKYRPKPRLSCSETNDFVRSQFVNNGFRILYAQCL